MESKALEQYLHRLKRALTCSRPDRERLLTRGKEMLEGFLEENPGSRYGALATAFGPPEVLAGEMLDTLDQEKLVQTQARRKWLLRGIAALVAAVLVFCTVFWYMQWSKSQEIINGDFHIVQEDAVPLTEEEFEAIFGVAPKNYPMNGGAQP